ncbi:hypothetical protein [Methyloceanibacter caenitepidi]|nr:hypothetical protein [Methyloceanibacter caenitepidi]
MSRIIGAIPTSPVFPAMNPANGRHCGASATVPRSQSHRKRLQFQRQHEGGFDMNLSAPTTMVFVISIVLAILAVLSTFMPLPIIGEYKFWVAIAAYVILAIGNIFRGV